MSGTALEGVSLAVRERKPEDRVTSRSKWFFCLMQEFSGFLTPEMKEDLVVDRSPQGELLRINFNISFPSLSCEFATLDVSDSLGTVCRTSRKN